MTDSYDAVSTTLTEWIYENESAQDVIGSIDLSDEKYDPPTLNNDTGLYTILKNGNSNFLSVLDGGDNYTAYDNNADGGYDYYGDMSHGQIVTNNVICKRIGDVLVDKYHNDKIRLAGGDPSYNTVSGLGDETTPARESEIIEMANAYTHSPGIGIRLLKNDKWDNSFNTQGFSVHGDSSDNSVYSDCPGYTYFDFSSNFLIGPLENVNEVQSHMHNRFNKDTGVKFIHHPTKNTIGEIETLDTSVKYKTTSDERLKTKIKDLSPEDGLDLCLQLRPVRYNWKSQSNKQKELGLIAQEVYKILDETYDENIEKIQMIDYSFFNPIIISAVQCIQKRIENLNHTLNK
jgi:hypothetical protein